MYEHFEGAEFISNHNRDKELQSLSPNQIFNLAKTTLKINLEDTATVLKKIGSLSLSEKLSDRELGMKIARFHEAYIKAKERGSERTLKEQPSNESKRAA